MEFSRPSLWANFAEQLRVQHLAPGRPMNSIPHCSQVPGVVRRLFRDLSGFSQYRFIADLRLASLRFSGSLYGIPVWYQHLARAAAP